MTQKNKPSRNTKNSLKMNVINPKGKPRGLKGGRKKLGVERGGLVRISAQLFADQVERLNQEGPGQGWLIRAAVDQLIAQLDKQKNPQP